MVFERAAPLRRAHELDQPELGQLAHVVADVLHRRAQLL